MHDFIVSRTQKIERVIANSNIQIRQLLMDERLNDCDAFRAYTNIKLRHPCKFGGIVKVD